MEIEKLSVVGIRVLFPSPDSKPGACLTRTSYHMWRVILVIWGFEIAKKDIFEWICWKSWTKTWVWRLVMCDVRHPILPNHEANRTPFCFTIICSRRKLPPIQPHARVVSRSINTFSTISLYFLKHRIADIRQNSSAFLLPLASVKGFNTFLLLNWIIAVLYSSRSIHTKWQTISVIATFQTPIQFRFSNRTLATKIITKTKF